MKGCKSQGISYSNIFLVSCIIFLCRYYPESLSAVISPTTNVLSHLTLALMEDTGWYKVNYTQGRSNPWGLNAGCDFVTNACLIPDDTPIIPEYSRGYFCNEASARGCSSELTHKMACTVIDYEYILPKVLPDSQFIYFPSTPSRGGPRQGDYCPV
jgi:Leishmanolysin